MDVKVFSLGHSDTTWNKHYKFSISKSLCHIFIYRDQISRVFIFSPVSWTTYFLCGIFGFSSTNANMIKMKLKTNNLKYDICFNVMHEVQVLVKNCDSKSTSTGMWFFYVEILLVYHDFYQT